MPATRLAPALELLAEVLLRPTFPAAEVERLRDERLNDLLQAQADPRRRADETFIGTIYAPTRPTTDRRAGRARPWRASTPTCCGGPTRGRIDPSRATLVVGGDLGGQDVVAMARELFGGVDRARLAARRRRGIVDTAGATDRRVRVVHRPGASRPRSGSAIRACPAASRTSTRSRS